MTFDPNANLDTSQVSSGGRGRGVAVGGGLGGGALLVVIVISLLTGTDPSSLLNGGSDPQPGSTSDVSRCRTGEDANRDVECRVVGTVNSVQAFWATALPQQARTQYVQARTVLYSGQTQSACGTASNAVGPFYCPSDKLAYIDASFFDELTTRFGADDGALAQEYVVAHEYGHHVQDLLGDLGRAQQGSGATGGSVRTELQADCYAGMWAKAASSTQDVDGDPFLQPLTKQDVASALSAASAVGDDRIQQQSGGGVNPETWTHGSSAERQRWFTRGYTEGTLEACDTFATDQL
ncbi:KPN_02809 family neutral zinc metallopeptidase [Angustibacter aerolatus]